MNFFYLRTDWPKTFRTWDQFYNWWLSIHKGLFLCNLGLITCGLQTPQAHWSISPARSGSYGWQHQNYLPGSEVTGANNLTSLRDLIILHLVHHCQENGRWYLFWHVFFSFLNFYCEEKTTFTFVNYVIFYRSKVSIEKIMMTQQMCRSVFFTTLITKYFVVLQYWDIHASYSEFEKILCYDNIRQLEYACLRMCM